MKRIILVLFVPAAILFGFELGVILGEPTGISFRGFTGSNAIDFQVGWNAHENKYDKDSNLDIHGAYLFQKKTDIRIEGYRLPFYFGPGGRIRVGGETLVGFKVPLGLYYKFKSAPFSMFVEISPGMNIIPESDLELSGGIGFRYIFGSTKAASAEEAEPVRERR
jgi:hypothetical protein